MIYTSEDIVLHSNFVGDCVALETATDLLCEHYIEIIQTTDDSDVLYEAEEGVLGAITKFIDGIIEKIRGLFKAIAQKNQEYKNKKAIEKLYTPEFKARLDAAKRQGLKYIEDVDVNALTDITTQTKKFILQSANLLKAKVTAIMQCTKRKELKKLVAEFDKLVESLDAKFETIVVKFEQVSHKKVKIPIDQIDNMAKHGINYLEEVEKSCKEAESTLDDFKKVIGATYESIDSEISASEKSGIGKKAATKLSAWWSKYSMFTSVIRTATYAVLASTVGYIGGSVANSAIYSVVDAATTKVNQQNNAKNRIRDKYIKSDYIKSDSSEDEKKKKRGR